MTKIEKEANLYKDLPTKKLKKVIRDYKFLVMANSKNFNFIVTLVWVFLPYFIFFNITLFSMLMIIGLHYFLFDLYLFEKKGWKLISDKDKNDMDQVLEILESYMEDRKTKNPSV